MIVQIVEVIVHRLSGDHHPNRRDVAEDIQITWNENEGQCEMKEMPEEEFIVPRCVGCSADPVGDLKKWQENANAEIEANAHTSTSSTKASSFVSNDSSNDEEDPSPDDVLGRDIQGNESVSSHTSGIMAFGKIAAVDGQDEVVKAAKQEIVFRAPDTARLSPNKEKKRLVRMGLMSAAAIAIHNFPEGLATFVAALHDPAAGLVLVIAIGAHNIPEGLCVSLPIYYATGSRWKGFMWGVISGMAEPVAAIMGWLVLANVMNDMVYAVLFALVSGMMIMISMKELLPTAHRYDPEDTVVTYCGIGGMALMALSLVLFKV